MDHTTFSCILVDIDISSPLLGDVVLMVGDRPWTQLLDFQGLPFCYRIFFSMGHLASNCSISRHKGVATWWKDATIDHLTIHDVDPDSDDFSQEVEVPPTTVNSIMAPPALVESPTIATESQLYSPPTGSAPNATPLQ